MKYVLFGVAILGGLVMTTTAKAETTQDHFKRSSIKPHIKWKSVMTNR